MTSIKNNLLSCKPQAPGQRHQKKIIKYTLGKNSRIIKSLSFKINLCVGRSSLTGHTTVFHRHNGSKRLYRPIAFLNRPMIGIVVLVSYDPNRACFVQNAFDFLQNKFIVSLAPHKMAVGALVAFCERLGYYTVEVGYRTFLKQMPGGSLFFGLHLNYSARLQEAKYARAAGTFCTLLQKKYHTCLIRLPSGLICIVPLKAIGTLGVISNEQQRFVLLGKAGRAFYLGNRPHVRGVAMNPVDHPHGGRTKPGRPSVTPWGRPALGYKTRKFK